MEEFSVEEFDRLCSEYLDHDSEEDWDEVKKTDKISVWVNLSGREIFGRKKWMKTRSIYPIDYKTMIQIYKVESKEMAAGHKMIKKFRVLEEGENTDVMFFVMRLPIPLVSNRYSVARRRWKENENNFYLVDKTVPKENFEIPKTKKKDILMRSLNIRKYEPAEDGTTIVTTYAHSNMGGNFGKIEKIFEAMGGAGMMVKMIEKEIQTWKEQAEKVKKREEKEKNEEVEGEEEKEETTEDESDEEDS